jgi:hypothetical protein
MKPGQLVARSANMRNVDREGAGQHGHTPKRDGDREAEGMASFEAAAMRGGDTC